jgi:branched-chain amino acid transport system permease protein
VALIIEAAVMGILVGGVYALMASGLTLIFGVLDIVNIAQGIFVVLGAYLSYALQQRFHIDLFVGLLLTMPALFALGVGLELVFVQRLKRDRAMLAILVMFALALIIEGALSLVFSTNYVTLDAWYVDATVQVGSFYIPYFYLFVCALSVLLLGALYLLVYRTRFGFSLQATMQNRTAASLIGIDVERVQAITFGIGLALAGAGGVAFGATNAFNPASSYDLISRLLVIVVLGGLGSLPGALIASILMVVIGDITAVVWSPVWSSTVFFVLLALLLLLRPQGLFGQLEGRKQ